MMMHGLTNPKHVKVLVSVRDIHVWIMADVKKFACMLNRRFLNLQALHVTFYPLKDVALQDVTYCFLELIKCVESERIKSFLLDVQFR
jgi:hypothetical protein